ncbi:nitroreductase [Variovorax saccharolyticus]|uniref:nitroreductase n=1 Tax=Variovorax saccharolyticus TaxID=3053516 RepID=UPI002578000A|nr:MULTISPECIES: nitroreductase [unclassified Variovorax]MDM0020300.1 nitroreductase [Variovorax sp. J22R187]MDM0023931.1 nitroreductase [Variovorax sp. J31P216]
MQIQEAVASRHSIRAFLPTPVDGDTIRRVLSAAARAPSGGNLQPWHIDVVAGDALAALRATLREKLSRGDEPEATEYDIYPPSLRAPWRDRRFQVGEAMYARLGIPREDKAARRRWFSRNFDFFGAPLALFCSVDRSMGPPQWSDLGMYLQTVMLLLRGEGLDSCAQECWAIYPQTVGAAIELPAGRMLFCGMAIGHRDPDHAVNGLVSDRAPEAEWLSFKGI